MVRWKRVSILCVVFLALGPSSHLLAQDRALAAFGSLNVPFDPAPPGARALGMGQAFVAVADDATASEANPAGLTILTRPEFSFHLRQTAFDAEVLDRAAEVALLLQNAGRTSLPPLSADTVGRFDESVTSVGFASYVHPRDRWAFSLYYGETQNVEDRTDFFLNDEDLAETWVTAQDLELNQSQIGLSVAFKAHDLVSVGASIRRTELAIENAGRLEFLSGSQSNFLIQTFLDESDHDLTFNFGVAVNQGGKVAGGVVYKNGGDFTFHPTVIAEGESSPREVTQRTNDLRVPDLFGVGLSWRPSDNLLLALDVNRITYSDLSAEAATAGFPDADQVFEALDDETEVHVGGEYTFLVGAKSTPLSVRAGLFTDPDHDGSKKIDSDQIRYTVGAGVVLKRQMQLDLAAQFTDSQTAGLASFVYRF